MDENEIPTSPADETAAMVPPSPKPTICPGSPEYDPFGEPMVEVAVEEEEDIKIEKVKIAPTRKRTWTPVAIKKEKQEDDGEQKRQKSTSSGSTGDTGGSNDTVPEFVKTWLAKQALTEKTDQQKESKTEMPDKKLRSGWLNKTAQLIASWQERDWDKCESLVQRFPGKRIIFFLGRGTF